MTVRRQYTGDDLTRTGINNIANRVHRNDRTNHQTDARAAFNGDMRRAKAAFHRTTAAKLSDRRACTCADVPLGDRSIIRGRCRAVAAVGCRPHVGTAADAEIEQNRTWYDGHLGPARLEADLSLVQEFPHAGRDVEAKRTAARQEDRVHLLHEVDRI